MSQSLSKNSLYLDRYFPVQDSPSPQPADHPYLPEEYAGFDAEYVEESDFGMEPDSAMDAAETEFGEEIPEGPTPEQAKQISWLEKNGEELAEAYQEAQGQFGDLQDGLQEMPPEEKAKRLRDIEEALNEIESDLQTYRKKEQALTESGLEEGELLSEAEVDSENLGKEIEALKEGLEEEIQKTEQAAVEAEEQAAKAEAQAEDNEKTKDQLLEALGYLNGSKGERYFTAKVWGKKHIKDYHEDVTGYAADILSKMADAAVSGEWDVEVATAIDAVPGDSVDNTLALIFVVLEKQDPALFQKIPSKILEAMSDAIRRGNSPGDKNIYYIKQDGKYDGPKDDRRRKDMHHENISYAEAAERLQAYAEAKRQAEEIEAENSPAAEEGSEEGMDDADL